MQDKPLSLYFFFMQSYIQTITHANEVIGIEREKYFNEKLVNQKGNARVTYCIMLWISC